MVFKVALMEPTVIHPSLLGGMGFYALITQAPGT